MWNSRRIYVRIQRRRWWCKNFRIPPASRIIPLSFSVSSASSTHLIFCMNGRAAAHPQHTHKEDHILCRVWCCIIQNIVELTKYCSSSARTTIKFALVCGCVGVSCVRVCDRKEAIVCGLRSMRKRNFVFVMIFFFCFLLRLVVHSVLSALGHQSVELEWLQCIVFALFGAKNSYVKQEKAYYTLWIRTDGLVHIHNYHITVYAIIRCMSFCRGKVIKSHVRVRLVFGAM